MRTVQDESLGPAEVLILAAAAAMAAAALAGPVLVIGAHVPRWINEGWNAYWSDAATGGGVLYPAPDRLVANTYTPLSFYIVGWAGKLLGDNIVAGRIIALAGLLVVVADIAAIVRCLTGNRFAAWLAALSFLIYAANEAPAYVAMNDPQWLGLAFSTTGALVFLARRHRAHGLAWSALACLLMLAGGLVKQNLIAWPLAVLIWTAWHERRQFALWLAVGGGVAAAFSVLAAVLYGSPFFAAILAAPRVLSLAKLIGDAEKWLPPLLPFLAIAVLVALRCGRDAGAQLVLLYAGIAALSGIGFLVGVGTSVNVLFDLFIGLFILAGLFADRLRQRLAAAATRAVDAGILAALILLLPLLPAAARAPLHGKWLVEQVRDGQSFWRASIRMLAEAPGPVACETPAACYWAHKPFEIDFFNLSQKLKTGRMTDASLLERLDRRSYAVLQLANDNTATVGSLLLPERANLHIAAAYRIVAVGRDSMILTPR